MAWSEADAIAYVEHHIRTWNAGHLDPILDLYADDAVLTSPLAADVTGSEIIEGKDALRRYFTAALTRFPGLRFEVRDVLRGVDGVTILMVGAGGKTVAEVLTVKNGRVARVAAHYSCGA